MTDEELQNNIEKGFAGQGSDDEAYRRVFAVLKREPSFKLSSDFAGKVIRNMHVVPQLSATSELVWLYVGLFSFVIVAGIAIFLTGFKINLGVLKFISGYPGLIVFGALFILALQWIDKRFVRKPTIS